MLRLCRLLLICGLLLGGLLPAGQAGATRALDDHPRVAVLSFTNKAAITWDFFGDYSEAAAENLGFELHKYFDVVEREELKAILDEHSLQLTGLVDRSTMSKIGKLEGIDYAIMGGLTSLTCKDSEGGVRNTETDDGIAMRRYKVSATVMIRVVDMETGRIMLYGRGHGTSDSTRTSLQASGHEVYIGTTKVSEEQCDSAVRKAVHDAVFGKEGIIPELEGKR